MKQFLLFILLFFAFLACNKKDEITRSEQFPEWLQVKIDELTIQANICEITDVTIIQYNGKKYYHVYCGLWSCMYCQFFDENGNRPTWNNEQWNDFLKNKKELTILPACE